MMTAAFSLPGCNQTPKQRHDERKRRHGKQLNNNREKEEQQKATERKKEIDIVKWSVLEVDSKRRREQEAVTMRGRQ